MSLSSKLRDFRKTLKKKKNAVSFDDDQMRAISRHMPRDESSLKPFLSKEQMFSIGPNILEITQAHTSRDQDKFDECILEMSAFKRGGMPGMECLNKVYPQILRHFHIGDDVDEVLDALDLFVNYKNNNKLTIKYKKNEEGGDDEPPFQR
jgi:hypothetical protein